MIVDVALPIPVGKSFSYVVPGELAPFACSLSRVLVPFHNKEAVGVIVAVRHGDDAGLKAVIDVIDVFPLVDEELFSLAEWSSSHYVTPRGLVFKYTLPSFKDLERFLAIDTKADGLAEMDGMSFKKAVQKFGRRKVLQLCKGRSIGLRDTLTGQAFSQVTGPSAAVPDNLNEKTLFIDDVEHRLEYYTSLISGHLQSGKNVMLLLPDYYAAGAYFTKKLKEIYGPDVLWFASGATLRQRMETYFRVRREGGSLILGNKNCVFLPAIGLSLVIVERFEDDEYRNEEGFKFNTVRLAIERARLRGASIVLGSGACSVDLQRLAETGGFRVKCNEWLISGRYPEKITKMESLSTGETLEKLALEARLAASGGIRLAIYTPRKDYGAFLRCHACKEPLACPDCGGTLSYHRDRDMMFCSHCEGQFPYDGTCRSCGSNMIGFSRIGVEFVEEHLRRASVDLPVIRITGDSLKKEISTIRKLADRGPVVLVGTQSLSKLYGFHVDRLILAGWEELRKMGGHRAEEKTHQIIANLIDALTPGDIMCFSNKKDVMDPSDYLDISSFYNKELKKRKDADFPPFSRVFLIQARKKTKASADEALNKIKKVISEEGLEPALFGMLPVRRPPFHIWKVILKGEEQLLHNAFKKLYDIPGVEIEADPMSF